VSPRIDLGTLSQGAVVDVAIEFVNSLDVDVVMTGVSSSCGCTVIDKTISIPAKSEAKLNVKLDTSKRKAGAMSVMVTTTWSNGDEVSINLVGTVEAVDVVAPGKFTVYVDAGHGGLDSAGRYTTPASNGKRFTHKSGVFHSGTTFFEGVSNRKSASMLKSKLEAAGFRVVSVYDEVVDTSLVSRTSMANADYTPANRPGMLISLHSNAVAPENAGRARGFCVYTSIGNTTSDTYATFLVEEYRKAFPQLQVRTDMSDGDPDYEANFHMLSQSAMPAILPENLFFDNIHDATLLMQDDYHDKYTDALLQTCVRARNLFYGVK
jgi:N-acetylmuramoyl-L-alanine amidase